ncbi:MAG: hypothetical protein DI537_36835 [Stutzerimonas stutzeri]|nr:MAG: hypothetical protein DI537_36835 [Stutzerimonas stutzeri]
MTLRTIKVAVAMLTASGCATLPEAESARPSVATHLPVLSFKPDVMLTALARGRLVVRNGCIRLVGKEGDDGMLVIWPAGSQLVTKGGRQIVVVGGSGRRLFVGSSVSLGGGGSDQLGHEVLREPLPPTCTGPYFSGY